MCGQPICVIGMDWKLKWGKLQFVLGKMTKWSIRNRYNLPKYLQRRWSTYKYVMLRRILHFCKWLDGGIQEYLTRSIICFFLVAPVTWWWQNQGKVTFCCCICIFFFPISFHATRPKAFWGIWCQLGNSQGNCCCNMQKIWPLVYTPSPPPCFYLFLQTKLRPWL